MTLRQWLLLSLLASLWGSAFIFMEVALPTFTPLMIVMGRMVVAAVVLNIVRIIQRPNQPDTEFDIGKAPFSLWLQCAGLSITNTLLPFGLVVWGQQYITASLASILIAAAPIFTVVLATFILKEKLTPTRGLGVLLGFSGVVVLVGPDVLNGFSLAGAGELAIVGAALSYSISGFWGSRFKAIPPQTLTTMTITAGALMVVVIGVLFGGPFTFDWQLSAVLSVGALGVFSTAIAYILYFNLLPTIGVVNTSLVSFLVPLSALLLSTLFLKETLDTPSIIGMSLILSGLAVLDGRLLKQVFNKPKT